MNNDLEQFSEERLKQLASGKYAGTGLGIQSREVVPLARIALAAKQAKPVGFVGKSYTMTYFMPPQDSGVEIGDLIYTTPPANYPAIPDGWKLVPIEPTEAMLDEFDSIIDFGAEDSCDAWGRLIAAAPKPESE